MALFDTTSFRIMEQGLKYTSENKKVIAHNIANIDTPNFKSQFLTFSGVLSARMDENAKYKMKLDLKQNDIVVDEDTKGQPDGNNVDYELQASMLKSNALRQEAIILQLESEMRMMKSAMQKN